MLYGDHYVCDYETHTALYGPMTCREAVDFIISQGDLKAQARFCNMSRYALAKEKRYPRNKRGDEQLREDVESHRKEMEEHRQRMLRRERIAFLYTSAMDRGDFEAVSDVLAEAYDASKDDPEIDRVISEINEELMREAGIPPATDEDVARASELVRSIIERARSKAGAEDVETSLPREPSAVALVESAPVLESVDADAVVKECERHGIYVVAECPGCGLERRHPGMAALYDDWLRRLAEGDVAPDAHLEGDYEDRTAGED